MGDFRRLVETYGESIDILKAVTNVDEGNIVTIYENNPITNARRYLPEDSNSLCNGYIKSLFLRAEINSLSEAPFPEILATDSAAQKAQKALNIEWGGERYRLDIFKKKAGTGWLPIGAVSLINPMGYPYRTYNLQDLFTNALAIEVAEGTAIGCKITDCGWGHLKSNDSVVVFGSTSEEVAVIESNSVLPPGVSLGNLAFQDKENVHIKNGIIENLHEPLPIIAGGTGVDTPEALQALFGGNANLSTIEGTELFTANRVLQISPTGDSIQSIGEPEWLSISLLNSWTNVAGSSLRYRQWSSRMVEVRGTVTRTANPTVNSALASIPVEFAPNSPISLIFGHLNSATQVYISIETNGNILWRAGQATFQCPINFVYCV